MKSCNQSKKPSSKEYRTGYGAMVINNITGTNSLRSNCEQDSSASILSNIHEFILDVNNKQAAMDVDEVIDFDPNYDDKSFQEYFDVDSLIVFDPESDEEMVESNIISNNENRNGDGLIVSDAQFENESLSYFENEAISRASNMISQKLMKSTHCLECKNILQTTDTLVRNCVNVLCGLNKIIHRLCSETSLKKKLLASIESIKTDVMGCPDHYLQMTQKLKELSADQTITSFCYDINSFLSGKRDVLPLNYNHIQKLAFSQYDQKRKKKKIGKYSDIFNS